MKLNGKYFLAPQETDDNFKVLFARLASAGAGRPANREGHPDGPWTPELLTQAISDLKWNDNGVELRTVQVWFQHNHNGISAENIKWLARIFGCNDPDASSRWQAELSASKERLAKERRNRRNLAVSERLQAAGSEDLGRDQQQARIESENPSVATSDESKLNRRKPRATTLAEKTDWVMSGSASMNLLISYWLVLCGLGYHNYAVGTLSVTYSPYEGLDKQVGFIWAPTLTILPLIVLPAYIFYVSDLTTYWKRVGRPRCTFSQGNSVPLHDDVAWLSKVNDFSFSFWAITLFCFFFVCCFQWFGIYLPAYLSGDANGVQIDRYLVTLLRPDVISIPQAMVLSAIGYIYSASYIAIFMFGLLFLVIVVFDYYEICATLDLESALIDGEQVRREGQKIVWGGFRVAVFGLWLATLLKLHVTYLSSDAENTVSWLVTDALSAVGIADHRNGWLDNTSITHFTTFLMVVVTAVIFLVTLLKIGSAFQRLSLYNQDYPFTRDRSVTTKMLSIVALLTINMILIGRFEGFSLLLVISAFASMYVLMGPKLRNF